MTDDSIPNGATHAQERKQHICTYVVLFSQSNAAKLYSCAGTGSQWIRPHFAMATMNISLPDPLKDFVDEQVKQRGYSTISEYVHELILKDQDRLRLRRLLLSGTTSAQGTAADHAWFEGRRHRTSSAERKKALDQVVIASEDMDGYDLP